MCQCSEYKSHPSEEIFLAKNFENQCFPVRPLTESKPQRQRCRRRRRRLYRRRRCRRRRRHHRVISCHMLVCRNHSYPFQDEILPRRRRRRCRRRRRFPQNNPTR